MRNGPYERMTKFFQEIEDTLPELSKSDAKIARFLIQNQTRLSMETGASIAKKTDVSEITVSRFLRKFGVQGMNGLRELLFRNGQDVLVGFSEERSRRLESGELGDIVRNEVDSLVDLLEQIATPKWKRTIGLIAGADRVYVTGFQTVRGLTEDFTRRLSIVRGQVQFMSAYDSSLAEWLPSGEGERGSRVLIMADIVPYARESEKVSQFCVDEGIGLVIVTDDMNGWAQNYTEEVFYLRSKVGTVLETTGPMTTFMNLIAHAVAATNPERTKRRLAEWPKIVNRLDIY